ncbi:MAG: phenylalanine--tRNA ligase subunit beta [Bacteroidales bacterium]|nr:phenylalanine--tRNA ligase subunit beta [Bacteroidales bacterium]
MKISYNWLKEYLNFSVNPDELSEILTNLGLEVESMEVWESLPGGLRGVVIGKVLTCFKHPDADKLTVTTVDTGGPEPLQIVCGAPNVAAGQKVPVALPGTIVYKGDEQFEIKKSKIRGQNSEGMICAEDELGIGSSHEGIMVLDPSALPGTPASEYFSIETDTIYTIGLTPNRIDSGSHFGVARDVAAYLNLKKETAAKYPSTGNFTVDNSDLVIPVEIENRNDCRRYSGITISGVTVAESPQWLQNRLKSVGMKPINNIVDITNFVLLETGQPLHAFDADKIKGGKVIVRNMPAKSKFVTLDGVTRELSHSDLMICNTREPMCIAGVFGGLESGVMESTRNLFLESAWFNPVTVRRTSKRHTLHTDASFHFERGADINITVTALKRAAVLISEIAGGKISSEIIDVYPVKAAERVVKISYDNVNRLIGKKIEPSVIKKILRSLDFSINAEPSGGLELSVPLYRVDVTREADVIEEILRIYGFNNVETNNHLNSTLSFTEKPDKELTVNTISDMLAANGFSEMMSNSLVPSVWFENNPDFEPANLVILANPLSSDLNAMRQSLLPGGLNAIARNINRQNNNLRLFEFGNCYFLKSDRSVTSPVENYREKFDLDLFITGSRLPKSWNCEEVPSDFYFIRSFVEMVLRRMGVDPDKSEKKSSSKGYFSDSIEYAVSGRTIAVAGNLSSAILEKFDIRQEVFYGHIEWENLFALLRGNQIVHKPLPKYPSVRRDLALIVDSATTFEELRKLAFATERNILREVGLFDVYEHESLGKGKKSYALSFVLRDDLKTLNEKGIDKIMNNLIRTFETSVGAIVRK